MKKIRYEYDHITGTCHTSCKYKPSIMVGSVVCKSCEFCVSYLEDYQVIICNFSNNLQKIFNNQLTLAKVNKEK